MNELEKVYEILDKSDWDYGQITEIENALKGYFDKMEELEQEKHRHLFQLEQEVFAFNKRPDDGLSYKFAGTKKMEDGTEVLHQWPDIKEWKETDFDYIKKRYQSCKNLFAKTEYGLILFYSGHLKHNISIHALLEELFELAKSYLQKALADKPIERNYEIKGKNLLNNFYALYFRTVLTNTFYIANQRKDDPTILSFYNRLILFTSQTHKDWDLTISSTMRGIIDLTYFALDYYKDFVKITKVEEFIKKNWETAEYISKINIWGSIYVADVSILLCKKLNISEKKWLLFKASQYEKLAEDSQKQNNMAAVTFIEKAMEIYKGLKEEENLRRIQSIYQKLRSTFSLGTVSYEMPEDETQRIIQHIRKVVQESSEEEILRTLMFTPMIRPLEDIRKMSEDTHKETVLLNLMPSSILDKFGNTIATYNTPEEKEKFKLLQTYQFHLQIAVPSLLQLFIDSFKANKISADSVIAFLNQTWLNQNNTRVLNGRRINISYSYLIESGIKSLFSELNQWNTVPGYLPNLVSATDCLVLKTEYLLREFAGKIGLPTFKPKAKEPSIIMEKTLDDLLHDLENQLIEDDHYFIRFILTEKAGYNLRNRIAHGLMDNVEYGLEYPILALVIILKLSNYQFSPA